MRTSLSVLRKRPQVCVGVLRKYRRLRRRSSLKQEYKKLRSLLPGSHRAPQLRRKVGVVDAAYQYICELQSALLAKFSTKGVPADLAGVVGGKVSSPSDVQALALHLIHSSGMSQPSSMATPSAAPTPAAAPTPISTPTNSRTRLPTPRPTLPQRTLPAVASPYLLKDAAPSV